jgi:nucleotide-binding universal stress UspA family protein
MMAKRILVPIGRDERAEAIIPVVAALARDAGATVRLLRVHPVQRTSYEGDARKLALYGHDQETIAMLQRRALAYGHEREERVESESLHELGTVEARIEGVPVERRVRFCDVVDEIVLEAEAFDADLIAVAERRRPWWRPSLDRIVSRVRSRARVPVLALAGAGR